MKKNKRNLNCALTLKVRSYDLKKILFNDVSIGAAAQDMRLRGRQESSYVVVFIAQQESAKSFGDISQSFAFILCGDECSNKADGS